MAVLVEAISLLIRVEAIRNSFWGGVNHFVKLIPNQTLCSDGLLCRVGFMAFEDAIFFSNQLLAEGLASASNEREESPDLALASQAGNLIYPCSWIELREYEVESQSCVVWGASIKGQPKLPLALPYAWTFEEYQSLICIEENATQDIKDVNETLQQVTGPDGVAHYVGRPFHSRDSLKN